jgi:hypothetical protein
MSTSNETLFNEINKNISEQNLDAIKELYKDGIDPYKIFLNNAIEKGDIEIIEFFIGTGSYTFNTTHMSIAANNDNLPLMKYLYEAKCPWDSNTPSDAAKNGYLECLKFAIDNGCEYNYALRNAAHGGKLDCIRYLIEEKKEWADLVTVELAAESGSLNCIKYFHQIGSPFRQSVLVQAKLARKQKIINYLIDNVGLHDNESVNYY